LPGLIIPEGEGREEIKKSTGESFDYVRINGAWIIPTVASFARCKRIGFFPTAVWDSRIAPRVAARAKIPRSESPHFSGQHRQRNTSTRQAFTITYIMDMPTSNAMNVILTPASHSRLNAPPLLRSFMTEKEQAEINRPSFFSLSANVTCIFAIICARQASRKDKTGDSAFRFPLAYLLENYHCSNIVFNKVLLCYQRLFCCKNTYL